MSWVIYKHTSPSNKCYIGITSRNPEKRWKSDGSGYKRNPHFWAAIKKYGWENFIHEILYNNLEERQAKIMEISLIRYYNTINNGYNMTFGGEGMLGYKHSEETKNKLKCIHFGIKRSDSVGEKLKNYYKNNGHPSTGRTGKLNPRSKTVLQYSLDGSFINKYDSYRLAEKATGTPHQSIAHCCNNKRGYRTANNFIWINSETIDKTYKVIVQLDNNGNILKQWYSYIDAARELNTTYETLRYRCIKETHGFKILTKTLPYAKEFITIKVGFKQE